MTEAVRSSQMKDPPSETLVSNRNTKKLRCKPDAMEPDGRQGALWAADTGRVTERRCRLFSQRRVCRRRGGGTDVKQSLIRPRWHAERSKWSFQDKRSQMTTAASSERGLRMKNMWEVLGTSLSDSAVT